MISVVRNLLMVARTIKWVDALETLVLVSAVVCDVGAVLKKHHIVGKGQK